MFSKNVGKEFEFFWTQNKCPLLVLRVCSVFFQLTLCHTKVFIPPGVKNLFPKIEQDTHNEAVIFSNTCN